MDKKRGLIPYFGVGNTGQGGSQHFKAGHIKEKNASLPLPIRSGKPTRRSGAEREGC